MSKLMGLAMLWMACLLAGCGGNPPVVVDKTTGPRQGPVSGTAQTGDRQAPVFGGGTSPVAGPGTTTNVR